MKRILSLVVALCLILSLCPVTLADSGKQHDYAAGANSGIRHEVCTSLLGTSADSYYTGSYTYDNLSQLCGDDLLAALRTLMTETHEYKSTYANCRDWAVLTDCQNGDGVTISLIFTSYVATWNDWCNEPGNIWDREHVWPQSLGGFKTSGAGADLHHIRPVDRNINSGCHSNKKYGNAPGGTTAKGVANTGYAIGGTYNSTYFEPLDNAKGDIARICLYMYARYGNEYPLCNDLTNVFESVDVLLEWCALDPVDTWEMGRNEVVGDIQGNRNVFIDYPELAWLLFDEDIPTDMITPSGEAANYVPDVCTHSNVKLTGAARPTCSDEGYTGDAYCADCGEKLESGHTISPTGHTNADADNTCDTCGRSIQCGHGKTELRSVLTPTCTEGGYSGDSYCVYCDSLLASGEALTATGHSYGEWVVTQEATAEQTGEQEHTCTICGYTEAQQIPVTQPPATEPEPTETEPAVTEPAETEPTVTEPEPAETAPTQEAPLPTTEASGTTVPSTQPASQEPEDGSYILSVVLVVAAAAVAIVVIFTVIKRKKA